MEHSQRFELHRDVDVTGVSGTGVVADGVVFPDGAVALRWRGGFPTSVVFHDRGMDSVQAVHGHGGQTRVVMLDGPESVRHANERADVLDAANALRQLLTGEFYPGSQALIAAADKIIEVAS